MCVTMVTYTLFRLFYFLRLVLAFKGSFAQIALIKLLWVDEAYTAARSSSSRSACAAAGSALFVLSKHTGEPGISGKHWCRWSHRTTCLTPSILKILPLGAPRLLTDEQNRWKQDKWISTTRLDTFICTSVDAFVGRFVGASVGVLEGLKTGKSTLSWALLWAISWVH